VGDWYLSKTPDALAYQMLKYRSRDGWTHRDLLRKSHPAPDDLVMAKPLDYVAHQARIVGGGEEYPLDGLPDLVVAFERAKTASTEGLVDLIGRFRLSWEMLPTEALNQPEVWRALLDPGLPITALMRQPR
jgi:60 kDa SS-A/Ro ribonucleoprotein